MLEKLKNSLYRFMAGRYGTDALNNFLLFASLNRPFHQHADGQQRLSRPVRRRF